MYNLEWKEKYQLGVSAIDDQHKFFLSLIKHFYEESHKIDNDEFLMRMMDELSLYAQFHFCSEENIMLKFNYPDQPDHADLHADLIDNLTTYTSSGNVTKDKTLELVDFLIKWFFKHTLEEDMKFAKYLSSHQINI
ncbi:MAG: hemerythrin family protein [Fibrobacterales bacterium]